ncbi:hypothetical protein HDU82_008726 [Entophlyctis luteolus]|nr:hypothetical protein HDU82_008726 [Entophlyctis luteolus]
MSGKVRDGFHALENKFKVAAGIPVRGRSVPGAPIVAVAVAIQLVLLAVVGVSAVPAVTQQSGSVLSVLASISECSTMYSLFQNTAGNGYISAFYKGLSLSATSGNATKYTVLAFTNNASDALASSGSASASLLTNVPNQAALLTYHIIPGAVLQFNSSFSPVVATGLSRYGNEFDNLGFGAFQNILMKLVNGAGQFSTGTVTGNVVRSIVTDLGIIHIIDTVMAIPEDFVNNLLGLTDFSAWISATNISSNMKQIQGYTLLIPQQGGISTFLKNLNSGNDISGSLKQAIIQYHMIPGVFFSNQLGSSAANGFPIGAGETGYFNSQPIFLTANNVFSTSTSGGSSSSGKSVTIVTPDIVFDSGVIHIVDTVLLPPSVSNAQASPSVNTLSQIYPDGEGGSDSTPLGSDLPVGVIAGSVVGGIAAVALGIGLFIVLRRRWLINRLEAEKREKQLEMGNFFNGGDHKGTNELRTSSAAHMNAATPQEDRSDEEPEDDDLTQDNIPGKSVVPLKNGDDDDDDDDSDNDDGNQIENEEGIQASYDLIMQYRRSQWTDEDSQQQKGSSSKPSKRSSVANDPPKVLDEKDQKRNSVVISLNVDIPGKHHSHSAASASPSSSVIKHNSKSLVSHQKRVSTISTNSSESAAAPSIVVTDAKEARKESIRNSWWSNVGVGGNTTDAAVLEAQALREEERKSWWSGSSEIQEKLQSIENSRRGSLIAPFDRRKSTASSGGDGRRGSAFGLSLHLPPGDHATSEPPPSGELEYVNPKERRGPSLSVDKRRSWKPRTSALVEGTLVEDENEGPSGNIPANPKRKQKRKSGSTTGGLAAAAAGENPRKSEDAGTSALAFVVGTN